MELDTLVVNTLSVKRCPVLAASVGSLTFTDTLRGQQ